MRGFFHSHLRILRKKAKSLWDNNDKRLSTVDIPKSTLDIVNPTVDIPKSTVDIVNPTVDKAKPTAEMMNPTLEKADPTLDIVNPTVDKTHPTVDILKPTVDIGNDRAEKSADRFYGSTNRFCGCADQAYTTDNR